MALFELRFHAPEAQFALQQLRAMAPQAVARSLNRAAVSARAVMVTSVARDLGLKVGVVREAITITEARPGQEVARVVAQGARIPLIDFGATGPFPSRGRGRGVSARIQGRRRIYPRAFLATMRSGHRGVFVRTGAPRLPITELHGPSLPHVFDKYAPAGLQRGYEALLTNLRHELRRAVSLQG